MLSIASACGLFFSFEIAINRPATRFHGGHLIYSSLAYLLGYWADDIPEIVAHALDTVWLDDVLESHWTLSRDDAS